jgi:hypothetical protein
MGCVCSRRFRDDAAPRSVQPLAAAYEARRGRYGPGDFDSGELAIPPPKLLTSHKVLYYYYYYHRNFLCIMCCMCWNFRAPSIHRDVLQLNSPPCLPATSIGQLHVLLSTSRFVSA